MAGGGYGASGAASFEAMAFQRVKQAAIGVTAHLPGFIEPALVIATVYIIGHLAAKPLQ